MRWRVRVAAPCLRQSTQLLRRHIVRRSRVKIKLCLARPYSFLQYKSYQVKSACCEEIFTWNKSHKQLKFIVKKGMHVQSFIEQKHCKGRCTSMVSYSWDLRWLNAVTMRKEVVGHSRDNFFTRVDNNSSEPTIDCLYIDKFLRTVQHEELTKSVIFMNLSLNFLT